MDDDQALASPATTPPPDPTPGVGLFWRAGPGHFWKAPKLTQFQYPLIEDVDGRVYFHMEGASARDVALLSLWHKYPGRMTKEELVAAVMRHKFKRANATIAVSRIAHLVDEDEQTRLRLLQTGIRLAKQSIAAATP